MDRRLAVSMRGIRSPEPSLIEEDRKRDGAV
jgi:hypothetical protein